MTAAVQVLAQPRRWPLALAGALLLHAGLAMVFHQMVRGGSVAAGRGGIEIGLPPAGAAPGAAASDATGAEAAAVEPAQAAAVEPAEATAVVPAAVPEAAAVAEIAAAAGPLPERAVPPSVVPLYAPVEPIEADAPPPEEVQAVALAAAEPAMPVPPLPKAKPRLSAPTPTWPAEQSTAAQPETAASAPAQTKSIGRQGAPAAAENGLVGNKGKAGTGARGATGVAEGHSGGGAPGAFVDYKAQLLAWLEKHKEYPRRARLRRQEGTAKLYFVMDRGGHVLEYRILESSGYKLLDEEVAAMIERAQPLPAPPAALAGNRFGYTVPVWFNQR